MISNVGGSRPWYGDRNPETRGSTYSADAVAPHGDTQRWARTIPTGKKGYIQAARALVIRQTAAAPVGFYNALVRVTSSDASAVNIITARSLDNAVAARVVEGYAGSGLLEAGDIIEGRTIDASTGGTVSYAIAEQHVEFDA